MKNILLILYILPVLIFGINFSGEYNFFYNYFQNISYYSFNRVILNANNTSDFVLFKTQLIGDYYIGNARYYIPYPEDTPDWLLKQLPSYYALENSLRMNYLYISIYWEKFNIKLGKMPFKWGISQIYSPADIFGYANLMDISYIREGIDAFQLKYSFFNNTISFLYVDNTDYERTKQALIYNNFNRYFSINSLCAHYFDFNAGTLFDADTIEYILYAFNVSMDYFGPGLWCETNIFFNLDSINTDYCIIAGADYTLFDMYVSFEYFRNSAGKDPPYTYMQQLNRMFNKRFLLGKNYGSFILRYDNNWDIDFNFISFFNMDDYSGMLLFNITYKPKVFLESSFNTIINTGNINSDFFNIPPMYVFNIKYNF